MIVSAINEDKDDVVVQLCSILYAGENYMKKDQLSKFLGVEVNSHLFTAISYHIIQYGAGAPVPERPVNHRNIERKVAVVIEFVRFLIDEGHLTAEAVTRVSESGIKWTVQKVCRRLSSVKLLERYLEKKQLFMMEAESNINRNTPRLNLSLRKTDMVQIIKYVCPTKLKCLGVYFIICYTIIHSINLL